ncbi:unnamed protein product [Hermetia illucens]|uniref:Homeobox domain-containing protein n=1 Tax=Hermetia illucens TaxID=343691 RepID=A0A7R8YQ73_HERIL|nr:unnamed protein product [Hermetia illucens]
MDIDSATATLENFYRNNKHPNLQEKAMLAKSLNQLEFIIDKWFENRRAEEIKDLSSYDKDVDTYENFIKTLFEHQQIDSTRPSELVGMDSDEIEAHQQRMVELARGIRWLFEFTDM